MMRSLRWDELLQGVDLLHDLGLPRDLLELLRLRVLDLPGAQLGLESLDITQLLLEVPQLFGRILTNDKRVLRVLTNRRPALPWRRAAAPRSRWAPEASL